MFERGISEPDVSGVIANGDFIAEYPDDTPLPSCLILGFIGSRPLHVVLGIDRAENRCYVITVYVPDPDLWQNNFTKRISG
jgi:hypothetical protein